MSNFLDPDSKFKLIFKKEPVIIIDKLLDNGQTIRQLRLDGVHTQSSLLLDNPKFLIADTAKNLAASFYLINKSCQNILFLGLGGGLAINHISENIGANGVIDCVELYPSVIFAYKNFFQSLERSNVNLICADAKNYIDSSNKKYDIVLCDIFGPNLDIPYYLLEVEFYLKIDKLGNPALVINCHGKFLQDLLLLLSPLYAQILILKGKNTFLICTHSDFKSSFPPHLISNLLECGIDLYDIHRNSRLISKGSLKE